MAILNVLATANTNLWPFLIPLATATGVANVAAVNAAQPPAPAFADGGIVPGNRRTGDQILTRQNSREMDLNMDEQKNLFNAIKNGELSGGDTTVEIPVYLDGLIIARVVAEHVNNRRAVIRQRNLA